MKNSSTPWIVIGLILVVLCCLCIVAAGILGGAFYFVGKNVVSNGEFQFPSETDVEIFPFGEEVTPTTAPELNRPDQGPVSDETLKILQTTVVPVNDLREIASRLQGKVNISPTVEAPKTPYKIGDRQQFWVNNTDTNENFQVDATLKYITDHLYFWVQDGIRYDESDLERLCETFENQIYPTNRKFFGSEWTPGVDGDPHLYIVYASNLGGTVAGYFSSADEINPLAHPYSNAHELFIVESSQDLSDDYTYGILAHEFQHMIHWYLDRNEESWLNEGFSELAVLLNGYNVGFKDYSYINDPDLQLNDWDPEQTLNGPHYGASFLYVTYFLDRFGNKATQALVADQNNGMASVDEVMASLAIADPATGQQITADDIFGDWALTNYLSDSAVGDGRYAYHNYDNAPKAIQTEIIDVCPTKPQTRTVHQYGVDYIGISCRGDFKLKFEGSTQVGVVPENAYSGKYMFWSNKGDESDMTLTRSFDFTSQTGNITLNYWTWYNLEKDYDYLYLEASTDGESWKILNTPSCTTNNPSGNSYGCGYNGTSGDGPIWVKEEVDLSEFAGKQVQLRFEYVTDAAVNEEGLLLDDISIPEIGYETDLEEDAGGWEAAGFVRIENVLPQTYRLSLILDGKRTTVQPIELSADQTAEIPLSIGGDFDEAVLVVSGTTRFTRQEASYRFSITE
jgi:hypothetical protein